ncbi:uncharacterized protein LOC128722602 [Anopheles nili]|uniref:uncharacterized protein LOC128722602 n=1 Tax=Anopheles nili TaxID=185578 RepID=UPI00237C2998|nr:uncharacterized protein LOC128722602 [Anopheles nili]
MELVAQLPKLDLEMVKLFLQDNNLNHQTLKLRRTSKPASNTALEHIDVTDLQVLPMATNRKKMDANLKLSVKVTEKQQTVQKSKSTPKQHSIAVEFLVQPSRIISMFCAECDGAKAQCSAKSRLLHWVQIKQQTCGDLSNEEENQPLKENIVKKFKITRECRVVLQPLSNIQINSFVDSKPVLKKLQKQPVAVSPTQLETVQKLSMFRLIREYKGDNAKEFLKFCTKHMPKKVCEFVQALTIEQADTDLWHELRKGRITASRMHEASRCTMLSGSLVNNIMGISSGFSMAMKRGTDLEGHVFSELQKEYPGLRNIGLVLDPEFPWIGASPDGICDEFVLEIKCPYTANTHEKYVDVNKLSPKYFGQIQLQMHMTHKTKALLAVAALNFETTKHITKVWIDYDKEYVGRIMEESFEFWQKAIFKVLLKKRNAQKHK